MQSRDDQRLRTLGAVLVTGGLILSAVTGAVFIDEPAGRLPGVALGSETILVAERITALFAAWLLVVVVTTRALVGDLPIEVSGRGVRYADARASQDATSGSNDAFRELEDEMNVLRSVVFGMQDTQLEHEKQLRRYAMRDGDDGY